MKPLTCSTSPPAPSRQRLNQAGFGIDGTPIETVPKVDVLAELAIKGLAPQGEWVLESLCAQVDDEIFFPEKGGSTAAAKSVCRRCPVAAECLEYALANNERFGIWGGLSERERRHLMKNTPAA
jgi:WhiB family redox-sensing transcriptional regulator